MRTERSSQGRDECRPQSQELQPDDRDGRRAPITADGESGAVGEEHSSQVAALFLAERMGRRLLARTIGVHPSTVGRWLAGRSAPSAEAAERLAGTVAVWCIVAQVEHAEVVRVWFMTMKDALDDYSPAEMIAGGYLEDVAAVARAYVQRA